MEWNGSGGRGGGGGHKHTSIFSSLCDHGMKSSCNESILLQSCNTTSGLGFRSGMYVMALLLFASSPVCSFGELGFTFSTVREVALMRVMLPLSANRFWTLVEFLLSFLRSAFFVYCDESHATPFCQLILNVGGLFAEFSQVGIFCLLWGLLYVHVSWHRVCQFVVTLWRNATALSIL